MPTLKSSETIPIERDEDVGRARQAVRAKTVELGFSLVEQTKMVTAVSELARNIIVHGGGRGEVIVEVLEEGLKRGLRVTFADQGPGIADVETALRDGYSTGSGLGLGLGGSKRLVNEFEIDSKPGEGTRIKITRWK